MNGHKAVISVSKIDTQVFKNSKEYRLQKKDGIYDAFLSFVKRYSRSHDKDYRFTEYKEFSCILYKTGNTSTWKNFIQDIFVDSQIDDSHFRTRFPSYLLMRCIDENIYCVTAGRANNLIDKFKDKLFGISLIPKLIDKDQSVIRYISDYRVYGRRSSAKFFNRGTSNFGYEQNLESIYNELSASFNHEIQMKLGLTPEKNQDGSFSTREVSVNFSANIHINKQITFKELENIIYTVHKLSIDESANNFVVNFLVPANKQGLVQSEITDNFLTYIETNPEDINIAYNNQLDNFLVDYNIFYLSDNKISANELSNLKLSSIDSLEDLKQYIVGSLKSKKSSKSIIKGRYLKTTKVFDDLKREYTLFELLDQEYSYNHKQVYLMDGTWYVFIEEYLGFLNKSYKTFFDKSIRYCKNIFNTKTINIDYKKYKNEEELKKDILIHPKLIDSDMLYIDGVEIADAIFVSDEEIIFLHNKHKFNGSGLRDITGQISTSATILSKIRNRNYTALNKIDDYFVKLKNRNGSGLETEINKFKKLFNDNNTKITFICGFVEKVKKDINSNYVKYLLDTTMHKLEELGYNLYMH